MRIFIFSLLICTNSLIINQLSAQRAAHIAGDLLVSLRANTEPTRAVAEFSRLAGQPTELILVKKVADPMNIWLLHFDEKLVDENRMLDLIRHHPDVVVAQFNHLVEQRNHFDPAEFGREMARQKAAISIRPKENAVEKMCSTIPNDPEFAKQWQYINTGTSGGTVDADTDVELAWDVTTGGLTAAGDTIVVCVVDGGVNLNHPDLGDNMWKNWAEIPNNGLDDDQNGYIDDFRGWSTYSNSDNVTTNNGHGTPVCGIVGAQGNNAVGVAGVNWNVKIMFVAGGGAEANVLASYSYPYIFRKKYNDSNGQSGAFVVATNSSWGTDLGQPADAPLWCAFYDTLGKVGILSCGATANANYDIDTQGDLPTACPSDFMIAVTNCNRTGKKVTGAAYGLTTIDLGSFGQDTWTLSSNSYGGFGGTSGATPHVTGTIGLLYSAPCGDFISLAKSNPANAALLLKQFILDGVDPEPTLLGKTITGGRLNIDHAMQNLLASCTSCQAPYFIKSDSATVSSASISFQKPTPSTVVILHFRAENDSIWTVINNPNSPVLLQNLTNCTNYVVEMKTVCADTTSSWSFPISFKTDGCCEPVGGLAVSNISASGATISWNLVTAAQFYSIDFIPNDGPTINYLVTGTTDNFIFSGLNPCQNYLALVKTLCGGTEVLAAPIPFKTKGCGVCEDGQYCQTAGGNASEEWIAGVQIANLNHVSDAGTTGYENLTAESATLAQYQIYPIVFTPGFQNSLFNEYFRAWIDLNQDGNFDPVTELVFDAGQTTQAAISGSIAIGNVSIGSTRMRVSMKYLGANGAPAEPCEADFQYGQTKDFCVEIVAGQLDCAPPEVVSVTANSDSTANLTWDLVPFATEYLVQINPVGTSNFANFTSGTNAISLPNLTACTNYEGLIWPKCGGLESSDKKFFTFKTACGTATFEPADWSNLMVYPNPFSEILTISFEAKNTATSQLEIYNTNSQLIDYQEVTVASGLNKFQISTEKLVANTYFLKMKTAEGVLVRRVIKY